MSYPEQNKSRENRQPTALSGTELLNHAYDHMRATGRRKNAINHDIGLIGDWTNSCNVNILRWRHNNLRTSPMRKRGSYQELKDINKNLRDKFQKEGELPGRRLAGSVLFFTIKSGRDLVALIDNPARLQKGFEQYYILPTLETLSESIELIAEIMGLDSKLTTALKDQMLNNADMDHKAFIYHIEHPKTLKHNFSPYGFGHKF